MWKRHITLYVQLATLCFLLGICPLGCMRRETQESKWCHENGKLKVLSTTAMINDLVKEIGGEEVDAIALIRGELDPHSYELVKGDDEKFARADLLFYNGLGLEHGASLHQNLMNNPKAIAVSESILEKHPESLLIVDGAYDPHVWMDVALWLHVIDPIVVALSKKDLANAENYQRRGDLLRKKMQEADQKMYALLQAIEPKKRYLVTSHDAFHYFTRHYLAEPGEENWDLRCKAPEGLAPEAQMSVNDVIMIIEHIEKFHISVLFPESNVNKDSLRKILHSGKEKGFHLRLCQQELYGDSMGNATSYLEMMFHNVETIAEEFQK